MKSSLKLIIEATRIAINKSVENVTKKFSTKLGELEESIVKKIPIKLSELENDLVDFDTLVDDIESKMDKENPVGTGSFSMNRQDDSLIGDCSTASGCGTVANHFAENVVGTFNEYTTPCYDIRIVENQSLSTEPDSQAYYSDTYEINSDGVVWLLDYKTAKWKDIPVGSCCITGENFGDSLYCSKIDDINDSTSITVGIKLFFVESKDSNAYVSLFKGKRIYINKVTNQKGKYAHVVGNGESDEERSNAHTVDWEGNAWYRGDVYTGGSNQDDTNAKKLATEEYVDERVDALHWDDIEDKPFGEYEEQVLYMVRDYDTAIEVLKQYENGTLKVIVNNVEYTKFTKEHTQHSTDICIDGVDGIEHRIQISESSKVFYYLPENDMWNIYMPATAIKQLDEKYIPNTIARVLTADDALALSYEMGLVEPAGNNGYVFTDANGTIYTI